MNGASQVIPNTATSAGSGTEITKTLPNYSGVNAANINYTKTRTFTKPGMTTLAVADAQTSVFDVHQTTDYSDGLGRTIQTVVKQATPALTDLISPTVFDGFGREAQEFLPYSDNLGTGGFRTDPATKQPAFYNNLYNNTEGFFYSNTIFENSPLDQTQKEMRPGISWAGKAVGTTTFERANKCADSVIQWNVDYQSSSLPASQGLFAINTLKVVERTDENNLKTIQFRDFTDRIILTRKQISDDAKPGHVDWANTYYVYDDFGNIRYVLTPKAVDYLVKNSLALTKSIADELCYKYVFDERSRIVLSNIPGSGDIWKVYDARDRQVMSQDSSQRSQGKWLYTQYDSLNRPTGSGLWTTSGDRNFHQTRADTSIIYPSPSSGNEELTKIYYDDYDWIDGSGSGLSKTLITSNGITGSPYFYAPSNTTSPYPQQIAQTAISRGLVTGTKTKLLNWSPALYMWSTNFYDDRGRLIQEHRKNASAGYDTTTLQYSFSDQVLRTLLCHKKGSVNIQSYRISTKNEYDSWGRTLKVSKQIGNSPESVISEWVYNELGQLTQKGVGRQRNPASQNTYLNTPLDTLKYEYNIQGWLNGINKNYARTGVGNSWFGMELSYDYGFTQSQNNGNIAGIKWRGKSDGEQRAYGYSYDNLNRLTKANFTQFTNSSWNLDAGVDYTTKDLSYDQNGNILTMSQKGLVLTSSRLIDSLVYGYGANSNKLYYVSDYSNDTTLKLGDFTEITNTQTRDYYYDGNGNLFKDNNIGTTSISYNHLNLPNTIQNAKGSITYIYDAVGNKVRKNVRDVTVPNPVNVYTDYLSGFVYVNDTLQYILQDEGRIRPKRPGYTDTMYYDYFEKDHLGNVRTVLTDELKTDAYPIASNEDATLSLEKTYYGGVDTGRTSISGISGYPADGTTSPNNFTQKLSGNSIKVGTNMLLKVMAGDRISVNVNSWYKLNGATPGTPINPLNDVLSILASAVPGASVGKVAPAQINQTLISPNVSAFLTTRDSASVQAKPKAFLNIVLLNEQLKPVVSNDGKNSYFEQVGADNELKTLGQSVVNREITKSGYLYIYVSNETPDINVYFDNLKVTHTRGPLLEENHYYPFGLQMTGISSKSASKIDNKYKANGGVELQNDEFNDGSGLEWYDAGYRSYNAQIGRFFQLDPLAEIDESNSPYSFVSNNPISFADPLGLTDSLPGFPSSAKANQLDEVVVKSTKKAAKSSSSSTVTATLSQGPSLQVAQAIPVDLDLPPLPVSSNSQFPNHPPDFRAMRDDLSEKFVGDVLVPIAIRWLQIKTWVGGGSRTRPGIKPVAIPKPKTPKPYYYVTYTKFNPSTGEFYVGRSSGYGDPGTIVENRDYNHHMNKFGFGPAKLSTYTLSKTLGFGSRLTDPAYWQIRGSEQMQIDNYRRLGISGNRMNGISPGNTDINKFLQAAQDMFGL